MYHQEKSANLYKQLRGCRYVDPKSCEHTANISENVQPRTEGCEECEKEHMDWVALRLCLSCGHVGCCDSSIGRHATRHFEETGHPVMIALPGRSWKWCYVHKKYL